jgi:hypothetical protein
MKLSRLIPRSFVICFCGSLATSVAHCEDPKGPPPNPSCDDCEHLFMVTSVGVCDNCKRLDEIRHEMDPETYPPPNLTQWYPHCRGAYLDDDPKCSSGLESVGYGNPKCKTHAYITEECSGVEECCQDSVRDIFKRTCLPAQDGEGLYRCACVIEPSGTIPFEECIPQ